MDNAVEWYEIRPTDYYGEFFELVLSGFEGHWPQQFPKLETPALFTKEGTQLFVQWPKGTILETVIAVSGETSIQVDMSAPPDLVRTQKLFVSIDHYGHKVLAEIPRGIRVRAA